MLRELVYELVQIPGPSGFEQRVARRLKELLQNRVDEIHIDKIGNLIAKKKGTEGKHSLALVAHMDQVSMVVVKVDEFVWFDKVGWIDLRSLPSMPVLILGAERDVPGIICATSAHFQKGEEMKLWIDVGDRQKFVSPGDPVVFNHTPRWLDDSKTLLASHSIDDRIGCAILVEVARKLTERPRHDIYLVGSVQEEIGSFGLRHFLRQVTPNWLIVVDTCFAQDAIPDVKKLLPLRAGLGIIRFALAQPTEAIYPAVVSFASLRLNQRLQDAAQKVDVPVHLCAVTGTFSDANIAYEVNPEVESTHLMLPRRYSHSPHEVVDLNNGQHAVNILCQLIADSDNWED